MGWVFPRPTIQASDVIPREVVDRFVELLEHGYGCCAVDNDSHFLLQSISIDFPQSQVWLGGIADEAKHFAGFEDLFHLFRHRCLPFVHGLFDRPPTQYVDLFRGQLHGRFVWDTSSKVAGGSGQKDHLIVIPVHMVKMEGIVIHGRPELSGYQKATLPI